MAALLKLVEPVPKKKREGKPLCTLSTYEREQKAKGLKMIQADHRVFVYAKAAGIPIEFLHLAWYRFKDKYTNDLPDRKYRDWPRVFCTAVKENWMKIWYLDGDTYKLSNIGMQTQKAQKGGA